MVGAHAQLGVPALTLSQPVCEPLLSFGRRHEVLHLHLLKLARAEDEVTGCDLVTERLANLGDSERRFLTRELEDVLEVNKDPLRRLWAQVSGAAGLLHGPNSCLKH